MNHAMLPVALLVGLLPAQVIQVSGGGSALANAIATAPAGAVLVVAPGSYTPFAATGHLTVVAPQRATIEFVAGATAPLVTDVVGLGSAQPITLVGLDFTGNSAPNTDGMVRCTHAHLEHCTARQVLSIQGVMRIANCTITATRGTALYATDSTLAISDSSFTGGITFPPAGSGQPFPAAALDLRGSVVRAERISAQTSAAPGQFATAVQVAMAYPSGRASSVTIADSVLQGSPSIMSVVCSTTVFPSPHVLTLSNTVAPGLVNNCPQTSTTPTRLSWTTRQWTPGGASTLTSRHLPAQPAALLVSFDAVPFSSPLVLDTCFVGGTPNWWVHSFGVGNGVGETAWTLTLPASPAILYASAWLHGLAWNGPQLQVSAPLGGMVL